MKKEGGGGSYVWGTSTDVTDFLPVGLGSVRKVSVDQPMRLLEVHVAAPTAQYHLKDRREFPDLTLKVRRVPATGGPPVPATAEPAPLKEVALRPGVHEFFGAQHPRNQHLREKKCGRSRKGRSKSFRLIGQNKVLLRWARRSVTKRVHQLVTQPLSASIRHAAPCFSSCSSCSEMHDT